MPTKIEFEHRLDTIRRMQASGFSEYAIWAKVSEEWGVSWRQFRRYLEKARERGIAYIQRPMEMHYLDIFTRLEDLYNEAAGAGEFEEAMRVMKTQREALDSYRKYIEGNPALAGKVGQVSEELLERVFYAMAHGLCSNCGKRKPRKTPAS